jgi:hypothetical protein
MGKSPRENGEPAPCRSSRTGARRPHGFGHGATGAVGAVSPGVNNRGGGALDLLAGNPWQLALGRRRPDHRQCESAKPPRPLEHLVFQTDVRLLACDPDGLLGRMAPLGRPSLRLPCRWPCPASGQAPFWSGACCESWACVGHGWRRSCSRYIPLAVESVAWVSETKNTLSLVFFLLSLCAYLDYEGTERRSDRVLSIACYLAAMLSKASVVMLPVTLLLYCWWRRGRIGWNDLARLVPYFCDRAGSRRRDGAFPVGSLER